MRSPRWLMGSIIATVLWSAAASAWLAPVHILVPVQLIAVVI